MKILIVAGCHIEYTPVVRAYIEYLDECKCGYDLVEYGDGARLRFIVDSVKKFLQTTYAKLIFVNIQALPVALLASYLKTPTLIYWKLESNSAFESFSPVLKLQLIEWLLPNRVMVILPNRQRIEIQKPVFRNMYVLPNAPLRPYITEDGQEFGDKKLGNNLGSLVIYGNLGNPSQFYLDEWVTYVRARGGIRLTVIGGSGADCERVTFNGKLSNPALKERLCSGDYIYSIVGYRNTGPNTLYAAPNKLIESLACGVPVIGNSGNPYVADVIKKYGCGILVDFDHLNEFDLAEQLEYYRVHRSNSIRAATDLCLANAISNTPLGGKWQI